MPQIVHIPAESQDETAQFLLMVNADRYHIYALIVP